MTEQTPDQPLLRDFSSLRDLNDEELYHRIVTLYMSGYASGQASAMLTGMATALGGSPNAAMQAVAALASRKVTDAVMEDPISREQLLDGIHEIVDGSYLGKPNEGPMFEVSLNGFADPEGN